MVTSWYTNGMNSGRTTTTCQKSGRFSTVEPAICKQRVVLLHLVLNISLQVDVGVGRVVGEVNAEEMVDDRNQHGISAIHLEQNVGYGARQIDVALLLLYTSGMTKTGTVLGVHSVVGHLRNEQNGLEGEHVARRDRPEEVLEVGRKRKQRRELRWREKQSVTSFR